MLSFILAAFIWFCSAIAIGILLALGRVPVRILALVVFFGLISTYCAFVMWNGRTATAGDLRQGIRSTRDLVADFAAEDRETLGSAATAATVDQPTLIDRVVKGFEALCERSLQGC